jgi:transcriptional/translational regulatory protein YebC/TACO1
LESRETPVLEKQLSMIPSTLVPVADDDAPEMLRFLEAMEDLDDVQNVWANFDISDTALAAASD